MREYRLLTLLLWIAAALAFASGRPAAVAKGRSAVANDPRTAMTSGAAHEYALHMRVWRMR